MTLQVLEAVDSSEESITPIRNGPSTTRSFRPYGEVWTFIYLVLMIA